MKPGRIKKAEFQKNTVRTRKNQERNDVFSNPHPSRFHLAGARLNRGYCTVVQVSIWLKKNLIVPVP